jgi:hypothetical protein
VVKALSGVNEMEGKFDGGAELSVEFVVGSTNTDGGVDTGEDGGVDTGEDDSAVSDGIPVSCITGILDGDDSVGAEDGSELVRFPSSIPA